MEPKLKVHKWTGDSGYKYTDITAQVSGESKYYTIIVPTGRANEYAVQAKNMSWDKHSTYTGALEKIAQLITEDIKKAGGHTNGKT